MRRLVFLAAVAAALAAPVSAVAAVTGGPPPWRAASEVRKQLAKAEETLIIDGPRAASAWAAQAQKSYANGLASELAAGAPAAARTVRLGLSKASRAVAGGDVIALEAARAGVSTAIVLGSYRIVLDRIAAGDSRAARQWLLVREFRAPTRFSRPGADATLAVKLLVEGKTTRREAAAIVRADLLDTYQERLRVALTQGDDASLAGFDAKRAGAASLAAGYFDILSGAYEEQRGTVETRQAEAAFAALAAGALAGDDSGYAAARTKVDRLLDRFRAAPLSLEEQKRRAGQFERFLALVPVEYERGVSNGRVTKDFEIQEAVNFRDGVAAALNDLESILAERDAAKTAEITKLVDSLGADLTAASRGDAVADPSSVEADAQRALDLSKDVFPDEWKDAGATADFDVIEATLDRMEGAVAAGQYGQAEAARLEAYAFFEFGPEQRLRGLAQDLFVRSEGLFWYGADEYQGLAQLLERHATGEEVAATRGALDVALRDAEEAVGAGPKSTSAVVSNTAVIVFREGLEAVLILAALMAGMVGAQRHFRKPLLLGALGSRSAPPP